MQSIWNAVIFKSETMPDVSLSGIALCTTVPKMPCVLKKKNENKTAAVKCNLPAMGFAGSLRSGGRQHQVSFLLPLH